MEVCWLACLVPDHGQQTLLERMRRDYAMAAGLPFLEALPVHLPLCASSKPWTSGQIQTLKSLRWPGCTPDCLAVVDDALVLIPRGDLQALDACLTELRRHLVGANPAARTMSSNCFHLGKIHDGRDVPLPEKLSRGLERIGTVHLALWAIERSADGSTWYRQSMAYRLPKALPQSRTD